MSLHELAAKHQRRYTHATIHNVLAIIARIVPAAMGVPKPSTFHRRVEFQLIVQMRHRAGPNPRQTLRQFDTAPLVIERLDICLEFANKPFIRNFKPMRLDIKVI